MLENRSLFDFIFIFQLNLWVFKYLPHSLFIFVLSFFRIMIWSVSFLALLLVFKVSSVEHSSPLGPHLSINWEAAWADPREPYINHREGTPSTNLNEQKWKDTEFYKKAMKSTKPANVDSFTILQELLTSDIENHQNQKEIVFAWVYISLLSNFF